MPPYQDQQLKSLYQESSSHDDDNVQWKIIDGSMLEAGGQILRISLALCIILQIPTQVIKIRAGRKNPGLAAQHLDSLFLISKLCNSKHEGLKGSSLHSSHVSLYPHGRPKSGTYEQLCNTAGAISLMIQASLIPLVFADGSSTLTLGGGTDVSFSPPIDFITEVIQPIFIQMGIHFNIHVLRRGFYPKGCGLVQLSVDPLCSYIHPIQLIKKECLTKIKIKIFYTSHIHFNFDDVIKQFHKSLGSSKLYEAATMQPYRDRYTGVSLTEILSDTNMNVTDTRDDGDKDSSVVVEVNVDQLNSSKAFGKGFCFELIAETKDGHRFFSHSFGVDHGNNETEMIESAVASLVHIFGNSFNCVDHHLLDNLILPLSLANGESQIVCQYLTLHAQTAIYICGKFTGAQISIFAISSDLTLKEVNFTQHESPSSLPELGPYMIKIKGLAKMIN